MPAHRLVPTRRRVLAGLDPERLAAAILDKLTDSFPIGAKVTNFGVPAVVDGYPVWSWSYTGSLILKDPETGMRWVAKTEFCKTA